MFLDRTWAVPLDYAIPCSSGWYSDARYSRPIDPRLPRTFDASWGGTTRFRERPGFPRLERCVPRYQMDVDYLSIR